MRQTYKQSLRSYVREHIKRIIFIILAAALLGIVTYWPQRAITGMSADFYCAKIFPVVAFVFNSFSNFWMVSVSENLLVVIAIMAVILTVWFIFSFIRLMLTGKKQREYLTSVLKTVSWLLVVAIVLMTVYQLMHGINYNRTSVEEKLDLEECTDYQDYVDTLNWAYAGMLSARSKLGEDYLGVAHMKTSFEKCVYDANGTVNAVSDTYGLDMSPNYIRAKAVSLSNLWSYTDITGVYSVLLGEANVNTDYLDILEFPITLCHEISHAKGYAREYDCNMIAVLSCISSTRPDFRYAGYFYIFIHLYSDVAQYAEALGMEFYDYLGDSRFAAVRRDMRAQDDYEASLEEGFIPDLISRFSEDANNAFLEANGQEGGTYTYHIHTNFYVDFFHKYIRTEDDA